MHSPRVRQTCNRLRVAGCYDYRNTNNNPRLQGQTQKGTIMVYLKCIGRVGVLGVALGIGAGLAATPWAAYAKPSESDSPSSDSASSASEAPSASSPSSSSSATGDTTPTGPPNPDCASCVEQFNIAVGTPGEYQRVFHQGKLGRDVRYFARIPKQDCPF
jgi:hypothetical protein